MAFFEIIRDSATNFTFNNPTLALNTIGVETAIRNGIETDTGKAKLGNGVSTWNDLDYWSPNGAPYLVYSALLTQSNTDAPVATVLQNTLGGTVVWSYADIGKYNATLSGAFVADKTAVLQPNNTKPIEGSSYFAVITAFRVDNNTVRVETGDANPASTTFDIVDDVLSATFIEIRVYP